MLAITNITGSLQMHQLQMLVHIGNMLYQLR